jgi:hypothetical protein
MVTDYFGTLLEELSTLFKTRLTPDANGCCFIRFKEDLAVCLEIDKSGNLLVVSDLGTPSLGRYRENLFREALKANGLPPPRNGIFAYSKRKDSLVLYDSLPTVKLTAPKLFEYLTTFKQKADLWRSAIVQGTIPSYLGNEMSFGTKASGMFGL